MAAEEVSVLIVDDNLADLTGLERDLSPLGLRLLTLQNGHELLDRVWDEEPDLVLLDALLPGLSGFDLCKQIKAARGKQTLVVILTGVYVKEKYRRDALKHYKADGFATKPYRPADLQRLVIQLLARKLKTRPDVLRRRLQEKAAWATPPEPAGSAALPKPRTARPSPEPLVGGGFSSRAAALVEQVGRLSFSNWLGFVKKKIHPLLAGEKPIPREPAAKVKAEIVLELPTEASAGVVEQKPARAEEEPPVPETARPPAAADAEEPTAAREQKAAARKEEVVARKEEVAARKEETVVRGVEPERREEAASPAEQAPPARPIPAKRAELDIYREEAFFAELKRELSRCRRFGKPLTLILIRVDDLAQIVELFGQASKNRVLHHLAEQAAASVRDVDLAGLLSSQELVALSATASDRYGGSRIVSRIQKALTRRPFSVGEGIPAIVPALRFGMATYPNEARNLEGLLARARQDLGTQA